LQRRSRMNKRKQRHWCILTRDSKEKERSQRLKPCCRCINGSSAFISFSLSLSLSLCLSLSLYLSLCFNSWLCHRDLTERFTSRNSRRPGARQRTRAIDEFPIMRFPSRIRNPTRNRDVSRLISGIQSVLLAGRFFSNPLRDSILFPRGLARSSNKIAGSRAVFSYANNKKTIHTRRSFPPLSLSLSLSHSLSSSFFPMRRRALYFCHYSFSATSRFLLARQFHESARGVIKPRRSGLVYRDDQDPNSIILFRVIFAARLLR